MKITVQRSGGVAAMTRVWTVQAVTAGDKERWMPIVEACPWDEVPKAGSDAQKAADATPQPSPTGAGTTADGGGQSGTGRPPIPADRFVYSIRAGQRHATLPEQAVTGPWRVLVDCAKQEGKPGRPASR